jgi:hypothetical protein
MIVEYQEFIDRGIEGVVDRISNFLIEKINKNSHSTLQ